MRSQKRAELVVDEFDGARLLLNDLLEHLRPALVAVTLSGHRHGANVAHHARILDAHLLLAVLLDYLAKPQGHCLSGLSLLVLILRVHVNVFSVGCRGRLRLRPSLPCRLRSVRPARRLERIRVFDLVV